MINTALEALKQWLTTIGIDDLWVNFMIILSSLILVSLLSTLAFFFTRRFIVSLLDNMARRTKSTWDDIIVNRHVFDRLAWLAPALIIYWAIPFYLDKNETLGMILQSLVKVYMVIVVLFVTDSFFNAITDIYQEFEISRRKPIKGYMQVLKIIVYFIGGIIIISALIQQSPLKLLTGLGAVTAVLLLVFRDSILGLVGSIQISANDMVRPGDWITMSKFGADGTVIDMNLTTVKVQNWDKTISTIPTYALVSDSFQNWRGMEESGGRRIKRAIHIDMASVKFCTPAMLDHFKKIAIIQDYIHTKEDELNQYNTQYKINDSTLVNGRRLTNLGIFRAYIKEYLQRHPLLDTDNMTWLVRQLAPTEKGIPIEIYVFSKIQAWSDYEDVQSDIFDHILASIPEFDLSVFQNPTGKDFKVLASIK